MAQAHGAPRLRSGEYLSLVALGLASVLAVGGCNGGGAPAASRDGAAPFGARDTGRDAAPMACPGEHDVSGPDVSFSRDILPFFSFNCAFSSCHDGHAREAGLYLGPNFLDGPADAQAAAAVRASLLSASTTALGLRRVAPFEPDRSFLMLKIDGCQNLLGLTCGGALRGAPCGSRMPALSAELPPEKRDMLARWVARGAVADASDAGAADAAADAATR